MNFGDNYFAYIKWRHLDPKREKSASTCNEKKIFQTKQNIPVELISYLSKAC